MEECPECTKKCPICGKQMTLWISDAYPDISEYRHSDRSKGHEIDTSNR